MATAVIELNEAKTAPPAVTLPGAIDAQPQAAIDGAAVADHINPLTGDLTQNRIREQVPEDELPTKILVRQLGLIEGPNGPFGYIGADLPQTYSEGALNLILDDLRNGTYVPNGKAAAFNRPLDLNCAETTLFVFHLSDQRNWRFTRNARAITLGDFDAAERNNYYGLQHVPSDGGPASAEPPKGTCKTAYFIAKKTSEKFAHSFNINVELVFENDVEGENTLPMVIDPDVRFPGGSGS